ncbi:MmgE/PrpD family protein [Temperatibacter marinus]|uniref:MmgE/PrpD family protein n=1 Tax=Temperatibacter marinus TaxID=1456591 RepID=A0AA52HAS5_9PROT|nr:MmgE/PrpD family protein [Temperatibacter marinus]WND03050.1 MmgE/PrpD family protein [Temperatibacter marinus]
MSTTEQNPLFILADWISAIQSNWSDQSLLTAQNCFVDTVGCMVPGSREEVTERILPVASRWGIGKCSLVGSPQGLSAPMAALVNGTAAHALDFDDDFDPGKCHPSAAIIPALLAKAEEMDKTGLDLLDAYIVALEVTGRVGQALNPFHRRRGWHATATIGTIGATAGLCRLMELNSEATRHALSACTSMAAGFMSQFGSMIKPMHAGLAAMRAVMAAELAEAGITAGAHSFDGPYSLRTLMVGLDVDELAEEMKSKDEYGQKSMFLLDDLGAPLIIDEFGVKVKRFPNCGSVHRALDNLLDLMKAHNFSAQSVENIHVRAPVAHLKNIPYDTPKTPLEAKFSLPYGLAVGLNSGHIGLDDFKETALNRPEILKLYSLISYEGVNELESDFPTETSVKLKDGRELVKSRYHAVGSKAYPLKTEEIWKKFYSNTNSFRIHNDITTFLSKMTTGPSCRRFMHALKNISS